ncbi:hypothetical protein OIE13_34090 [Streptosporangium sp. NBC_01810]|uniref:hypothetical protein n=1 Tax=Streptosporangium sp. NBC_01810 TaxID=2975951 RepID=UPI002DD8737E|nr:hypothetical protein [Streptosporangium sp. NBC_01810]WSA25881.1 hypothetical protein OIE13_34090 [Streptosporangium sp. NBC_01810]
MNATTRITPAPATTTPATATPTTGEVDNRSAYLSFTLAYLLGHGGAALSKGADPLLSLPGWLPITLLGAGIVTGVIQSMSASIRAQRGAGKSEALAGQLAGLSWVTGFVALFLAITGLTTAYDTPELQSVLWPPAPSSWSA